jgi:hypothetical protein
MSIGVTSPLHSKHPLPGRVNECNGLFTTGTLGNPLGAPSLGTESSQEYALLTMKQPFGVLVIMGYFLVGASTGFPLISRLPQLPLLQSLTVVVNVVGLLFIAGGLYKMQGWARWASIVILAIQLVRIPIQAVNEKAFATTTGIHALFIVWAIHYLTRPFARAAFRLASLKRSQAAVASQQ